MRDGATGVTILMMAVMVAGCVATPVDPGEWGPDAGSLALGGTGGTGATSTTSGTATTVPVPSGSGTGGTGGAGPSTPISDSGTIGASCNGPAVTWQTATVSLQASAFWIVANGQCYTSRGAKVRVDGDPGWSRYTTLELTWTELGREMRFFTYFYADSSSWWSDEMRTYNGQQPYGDWLFYYGKFFTSPIGQSFHGDIDLTNDPQDEIRGELHLRGLTLSTTMTGK